MEHNNKFKAVIFDLDGTLINSLHDIADAMNRVLEHNGFKTHEYEAYKLFVGKGLRNLAENVLPESDRNSETIKTVFDGLMKDYGNNVVRKTALYEGIPQLLDQLTERNIKMAILSNKAHELTVKIADKILKNWKFEIILGSKVEIPRKPDPTGAKICMESLNLKANEILYVGDSGVDMQTANNTGMIAVGVTWGFRSRKELRDNGAMHIIDKPEDLLNLL